MQFDQIVGYSIRCIIFYDLAMTSVSLSSIRIMLFTRHEIDIMILPFTTQQSKCKDEIFKFIIPLFTTYRIEITIDFSFIEYPSHGFNKKKRKKKKINLATTYA
jgi:hypothetical protein